MLVINGGRERTLEEFSTLFRNAGLRLACVRATGTELSVLEAVPQD